MNQQLLANGVSVLEPKGLLAGEDEESVELQRRIQELLEDSHHYVVIDCRHVQFVNKDGLDMFRQIEIAFVVHRGKIVFANVEPRTKQMIRLTDLAGTLELYDTTELAVAYLARLMSAEAESPT